MPTAHLIIGSNKLTHVPPAIASLPRLEELNLSNNQITYLPSEITLSNLSTLLITSNPLLTPTGPSKPERKIVGPLKTTRTGVRSLREICLSYLLSPKTGNDPTSPSRLEETYILPFSSDLLSEPLTRRINSSLPLSKRARVSSTQGVTFQQVDSKTTSAGLLPPSSLPSASKGQEEESDAWQSARFNSCPAPSHTGAITLFVEHAEERIQWVTGLASKVTSSDLPNGLVPVLWRGCSVGCLDFLGEHEDEPDADETTAGVTGVDLGGADGWDDEFSLDP